MRARDVVNLSRPGEKPRKRDVVRLRTGGRFAGRVGEVEGVERGAYKVRLDPDYSSAERKAISGEIAQLRRRGMPRAEAIRAAYEEARRGDRRMRFLVNPPQGRKTRSVNMTRRQLARSRPRDARGRFLPSGSSRSRSKSSRKRNPARGGHESASTRAALRRAAVSRPRDRYGRFLPESGRRAYAPRHRRRNPGFAGLPRMVMDGAIGAVEVVAGKVGARAIPKALNLSQTGNAGLAIQGLVAVAEGWLAGELAGAEVGKMILVGGLSAPLESALERANIPFVSDALSGTMAGYAMVYTPPATNAIASGNRGRVRAIA